MPFLHPHDADMSREAAEALAELRRCCGRFGSCIAERDADELSPVDPASAREWQNRFARNHAR